MRRDDYVKTDYGLNWFTILLEMAIALIGVEHATQTIQRYSCE